MIIGTCLALNLLSWNNKLSESKEFFSSDGKGYYLYLPAIFIDGNLDELPIDNRYVFEHNGKGFNKYFSGTSLMMLPFFGCGMLSAYFFKYPIDGYSKPFEIWLSIGGLFYLFIGLFFLKRLLKLYHIDKIAISITLVLIAMGTNLLYYSFELPLWSHVYSFACISYLLFNAKIYFETYNKKHIIISAILIGIIVLTRPTNGIIMLLLPFLAKDKKNLIEGLYQILKTKGIIGSSLIVIMIITIQPILWYVQTGSFFIWNYSGEGFNFGKPEIWNTLFSFRKGLFIYTPILLIGIVSIFILGKKNKFQFSGFTMFFCILTYITSSWWIWYYGPSFGMRPFIDFYAVFGLLIAFAFHYSHKSLRKVLFVFSIICLTLNLVQTFQYHKGIINSTYMNWNKYKYVFLKTTDDYINKVNNASDVEPYSRFAFEPIVNSKNDFSSPLVNWSTSFLKNQDGNHLADYSDKEFCTSFEYQIKRELLKYRKLYVKVNLKSYQIEPNSCDNALLVVTKYNPEIGTYFYGKVRLNEIPDINTNVWKLNHYNIEIPKFRNKGDYLKVYVWNKEKTEFFIDDFEIELLGYY